MPRPPAAHALRPPRRRYLQILISALGICMMASGGVLLWSMQAYKQHTATNARTLIHQLGTATAATRPAGTGPPLCATQPLDTGPPGTARAVLSIPRLGLIAPILPSTSDADLNSGVGHLQASKWPDQGGTDVLEAHDVTFFSHLPQLHPGDAILITAPCRTWSYRTLAGQPVPAGSPVADQADPTLVLITCYPSDALFRTNQRYVLTATLTAASNTANPGLPDTPSVDSITAAIPVALSTSDLTPDTTGLPLGRLRLSDAADPTGLKSRGGLQASDQAGRLLAAAEQAASTGHADWWHTIAPQLPYNQSAPLSGPPRWSTSSRINITITADDGRITGGSLTGTVDTSAGARQVTVNVIVDNNVMTINGVSVTE